MDTPPPQLRPRGLLRRSLSAAVRILEKRAGMEPCSAHCGCVRVLKREMAVIMAVFLLVVGALVRREVLSYSPRTPDAPPPIVSGQRLPGVDPAR